MANSASSDTELLTEHFGYPPVSLLDDVINSINILAERALNSVEQGLLNAPPATLGFRPPKSRSGRDARDNGGLAQPGVEEMARHEIENGTHQLETLLCASIDRDFDKFELYVMRNILCVNPEDRDWIRLGHYEGLDFGLVTNSKISSDNPTVGSVNSLRRRLQASQKLNCMLHAERARNDALLSELRAIVGKTARDGDRATGTSLSSDGPTVKEEPDKTPAPFGFLQNKGDLTEGDAETPLTTTTAFTLSQMQALRALSTSLRNIMPDLRAEGAGRGPHATEPERRRGWRRERLEYVETATRKHLENVRGLDLGKNGEVGNGEWQGEGGKLAAGEVESLEKIVTVLGAASEPASRDDEMDET